MNKFNNIELLRFVFAWAIVGFHIVYKDEFASCGLAFLKPYLIQGSSAVSMFFVMAFFFLVLKTKPEQSMWGFYKSKWLRMAPLIVVVTVVGYILHICGYWGWNWAANIENCLMIHDWAAHPRFGQFVHPAWFVAAYMLAAVFYLGLIKTLSTKYHPLVLGVLAYVGWRVNILGGELPKYGTVIGHAGVFISFFCLGIGYALAYAYRNCANTPPGVSCRFWDILMLHASRACIDRFYSHPLVYCFCKCNFSIADNHRICRSVLAVYHEVRLSVAVFGQRLVRFFRSLCVRYLYCSYSRAGLRQTHCVTTLQGMEYRASLARAEQHCFRNHGVSCARLSLCRSAFCQIF